LRRLVYISAAWC